MDQDQEAYVPEPALLLAVIRRGLILSLEAFDTASVVKRREVATSQINRAPHPEVALQAYTWACNGLDRVMVEQALTAVVTEALREPRR